MQKAPSCTDGLRNQNEHGPDCGGICQVACMFEVQAYPTVQWSRGYYVSKGVYNLVAYLQNPNTGYISLPVKYTFNVFDKDNVLLQSTEGSVAFPTTKLFPIFAPTINVGERIPMRVSFDFKEPVTWIEYNGEKPELEVVDRSLTNEDEAPLIEATVRNKTLHTFKNVEVVAIVYDSAGNGFAASRTFIDKIGDRQDVKIRFTWPEAFATSSAKIEIIPKLAIDEYKK
ncbi:MAG: hypothetical protein V4576_03005 [Patescibacteria group bacterium]